MLGLGVVRMRPRSLAIASAIFFLVFAFLGLAVKVLPTLVQADYSAALWINGLDLGAPTSSILVYASLFGREYFWTAVVALMFVLGDKRTKAVAFGLSAVLVVGIFAGEGAKALVMRERPFDYVITSLTSEITLRVPYDSTSSFPSGHALIVSIGAFYFFLTFRKKWVAALLTIEAALVCVSRVYVGAHFPLDVVGGVALGAAIAFGGLAFGRRYVKSNVKALARAISSALGDGPLHL